MLLENAVMQDTVSRYHPVIMQDPIWKCFGYGQVWPL